jgi:hypothetical protein
MRSFWSRQRTEQKKTTQERIEVLQQEGAEYWALPHRAPDYYARSISRQLANVYATTHLKRPTFGTNNNIPSTKFAVTLENIFATLGISTGIRGPAEWAISQISESWIDEMGKAKDARKRRGETRNSARSILNASRRPLPAELADLEILRKMRDDLEKDSGD